MTIEKLLCLGVGFVIGVAFTIIVSVCLVDWMDKRK